MRHQMVDEFDTDTIPNVITLRHNSPNCNYSQTYWLRDCLEDIFPYWVGGPRPEPRNQGILTKEQLRELGYQLPDDHPSDITEEIDENGNYNVTIPTDENGNATVQMSEDGSMKLVPTDPETLEPKIEVDETSSEEE
jgi:hypothetical protein